MKLVSILFLAAVLLIPLAQLVGAEDTEGDVGIYIATGSMIATGTFVATGTFNATGTQIGSETIVPPVSPTEPIVAPIASHGTIFPTDMPIRTETEIATGS